MLKKRKLVEKCIKMLIAINILCMLKIPLAINTKYISFLSQTACR